jgi:hypothetical protein
MSSSGKYGCTALITALILVLFGAFGGCLTGALVISRDAQSALRWAAAGFAIGGLLGLAAGIYSLRLHIRGDDN